jgi:hypothetical protein
MSTPARAEFRCGDADLHAKQARLAGIEASGGLGKEDIHGVIAWRPYHSAFLLSGGRLTMVRKPKRDWRGATETDQARDHWRRPCGHSSGRLWNLAPPTRQGRSRLSRISPTAPLLRSQPCTPTRPRNPRSSGHAAPQLRPPTHGNVGV